MRGRNFLVLIFGVALLFFASCSSVPDCSEMDTTYVKYKYDTGLGLCVEGSRIQANVCGNGVIESGETHCNCPEDVPASHPVYGCSGSLGNFLEYTCSTQRECVLEQNDRVVSQSRSVEFRNSDMTIEGTFNIPVPYIQNTHTPNYLEADLRLFRTAPAVNIVDIVIGDLVVENTNSLRFGRHQYNIPVSMSSPSLGVVQIPLSDISSANSNENLRAILSVSYTREILNSAGEVSRSEQRVETMQVSIGRWDIINSRFLN